MSSSENSSDEEETRKRPTFRQRLNAQIIKKQRQDDSTINRILNDDIKFTETCPELTTTGMCQNDFCLYQHHPKQLICKYIQIKGCTDKKCSYQHPNPIWAKNYVEKLKNNFLQSENKKSNLKFWMPQIHDEKMSRKFCELFVLDEFCFNPNCNKQHILVEKYVVSFKNYIDISIADKETQYKVTEIWNKHSTSNPRQIKKIEIITNRRLQNLFSKREAELPSSKFLWGFHGTAEKNIEKIVDNGFSSDFQLRNAYGKGTYFAHDPEVSVGYCNGGSRMIMAKLLVSTEIEEEQLFSKDNGYYIIPNTSSILPLYVITFK
eukprot:gene5274-8892_t